MRYIEILVICCGLCISSIQCIAQKGDSNFPDSLTRFNPGRFALISGSGIGLTTASLIGLNELWYKQQPRSPFHSFDDNDEWLQMDKAGHTTTSYILGNVGYRSLKWAGVNENKSIWIGGLTGFIYLTGIEVLDGFSTEWGFSWGDQTANLVGSALFIGQQLAWDDQRIVPKFSYSHSQYAKFRPSLLGETGNERILKDYNGQTYWLSVNVASFLSEETSFPKWINFALGYGGDAMLTGHPVSEERSIGN